MILHCTFIDWTPCAFHSHGLDFHSSVLLCNFTTGWNVTDDSSGFTMAVEAKVSGYIAVGFTPSALASGADVDTVVAYLGGADGVTPFAEDWVLENYRSGAHGSARRRAAGKPSSTTVLRPRAKIMLC